MSGFFLSLGKYQTLNNLIANFNTYCSDISEFLQVYFTVIEPNTAETGINLYHNSPSGKFTIDLGREYKETDNTITMLDGRLIPIKKIENNQQIDLYISSLAGIFLSNISTKNESFTQIILKKNQTLLIKYIHENSYLYTINNLCGAGKSRGCCKDL